MLLLYMYVCNLGVRLESNLDISGAHCLSSDIARNTQGRIIESLRLNKTSKIASDCKITRSSPPINHVL